MVRDRSSLKDIPVLRPRQTGWLARVRTKAAFVWRAIARLWRSDPSEHVERTAIDWSERARQLGAYAVIDGRHPPQEYDYVTARQKDILLPLLKSHCGGVLAGDALDYGCGVGRFTADLASFVSGQAHGFDPTTELIALTPKDLPRVRFVDCESDVVDGQPRYALIWVCLVLGGLSDEQIRAAASRLSASLLPGGLMWVVEATAEVSSGSHWRVRTRAQLIELFKPWVGLQEIDQYRDVDQLISVFLGKRSTLP